jgi:hypothetical protein
MENKSGGDSARNTSQQVFYLDMREEFLGLCCPVIPVPTTTTAATTTEAQTVVERGLTSRVIRGG